MRSVRPRTRALIAAADADGFRSPRMSAASGFPASAAAALRLAMKSPGSAA